ncbi:MAG: hypothetical protein Q7S29_03065 [Candidatus Peribacter sp.]|nr:hypothetical protein [Candidatus Peribacter sp.]
MEKPTNQDRVFIAGTTPGVIVARETGAISDPTLAGFVGKNCDQILAGIEVEFAEKGRLPETVLDIVRHLRVSYLHAVGQRQGGDILIARFERVLGDRRLDPSAGESSDEDVGTGQEESEWGYLSSPDLEALSNLFLCDAEACVRAGSKISSGEESRLYGLRDAYTEALSWEAQQEGVEDKDGNPALYQRFKVVLNELPKKEQTGRPFPKSERVKGAETSRGGSTFIARK